MSLICADSKRIACADSKRIARRGRCEGEPQGELRRGSFLGARSAGAVGFDAANPVPRPQPAALAMTRFVFREKVTPLTFFPHHTFGVNTTTLSPPQRIIPFQAPVLNPSHRTAEPGKSTFSVHFLLFCVCLC